MTRSEMLDAWNGWLQAQQQALDLVNGAGRTSELEIAEGYRYVTRLSALALETYVEADDPLWPRFVLQLDPHTRKFACDSPDTVYWRAPVAGGEQYRVRGRVGASPYTAIALQSDMYTGRAGRRGTLAQYSLDDFTIGGDGGFELTLGGAPQPGNWIALPHDVTDILVRQTVLDSAARDSAAIEIERLTDEFGPRPPLTRRQWIDGLRKASLFLPNCISMFLAMAGTWSRHVNSFRHQPSARNRRDEAGGDPHVDYFQGSWRLEPREALLIEFTPVREFRLWSFVACNWWSESLDYAGGANVATNSRKATVDVDGRVRLIVSEHDPLQPNWIATTGHREGLMLLRWLLAEQPPEMPGTRVVALSELRAGHA
jgi:hypothetical protein